MRNKIEDKIFPFLKENFLRICFLQTLPFAFLAISIHIYYHYNQGARFSKATLPASHVYKFDGIDFKEFNFKTADNAVVNAGLFKNPKQPAKGVIYFLHGNAGNVGTNVRMALNLFEYGYDVMTMDWRGYGKSRGISTEKAFYDDTQIVYEELKKTYDEKNIYVVGHSFAGAMAANVASRNMPAGVILIGPLYSFEDAQQNCPWYYPIITEFPFRTNVFITQTKCPVYLISGTDDIVHEASERLSKLLQEKDRYIEIKGANHTDIFFSFPDFKSHMRHILKADTNDIGALVINN